MDPQSKQNRFPKHRPFQFSPRSLVQLMFVICLFLAVAVLSQVTQYIDAIYPFGILIAVAPVGIIWVLNHFEVVTPESLALGSVLLYATSLAVPALQTDHRGVLPGFAAFLYSFIGISMWGEWGVDRSRFWMPFAYTMGATTNLAFVSGYIALLAGFNGANTSDFILKASKYGSILAVVVLAPLMLSGGLTGLYPGYGLWAASLLALWLGTRRLTGNDCA